MQTKLAVSGARFVLGVAAVADLDADRRLVQARGVVGAVDEVERLIERRQPMKPVRPRRPDREPQVDLRIGTNTRRHSL